MTKSVFSIEPNKRQLFFMDWVFDIFLYTLILGLFVEFSDGFKIDSFTFVILTAIVLKIALFVVIKLEHNVSEYFSKFDGKFYKFLKSELHLPRNTYLHNRVGGKPFNVDEIYQMLKKEYI